MNQFTTNKNFVRQSIDSQRGEIEVRREFYEEIERTPAGDLDPVLMKVMAERMGETIFDMRRCLDHGAVLSPYLEVGAERGQRGLVMENDLDCRGAVADLSYHSLKSCEHVARGFGKNLLPLRVCCDLNNLPFASESLPFVFCYQTLHHFPDPIVPVKEVYRVLAPGGTFRFGGEPYHQALHLKLYEAAQTTGTKSLRDIVDYFLAWRADGGIEHGVVENDTITLSDWRRILDVFTDPGGAVTGIIKGRRGIRASLYDTRSPGYLVVYLIGGELTGICRKAGVSGNTRSICETFACPACLESGKETPLDTEAEKVKCYECGTIYPIEDDVIFLFTEKKLKELYPDKWKVK